MRASTPVHHDFLAPPAGPGEIGRLGRYRILKQLGAGRMGIVFQAEEPRRKRTVALNVLKPEAAGKPRAGARFLREAQTAAGLEHEHIVTIYEVNDECAVLSRAGGRSRNEFTLIRQNASFLCPCRKRLTALQRNCD